jgi:hypothetical protein
MGMTVSVGLVDSGCNPRQTKKLAQRVNATAATSAIREPTAVLTAPELNLFLP